MPADVLVDITVTDPEQFAIYRAAAESAIAAYGGHYLVRGGASEVLEGDRVPARIVVVEFPDLATVRRWYDSAEYRAARLLRKDAARASFIAVEGVD